MCTCMQDSKDFKVIASPTSLPLGCTSLASVGASQWASAGSPPCEGHRYWALALPGQCERWLWTSARRKKTVPEGFPLDQQRGGEVAASSSGELPHRWGPYRDYSERCVSGERRCRRAAGTSRVQRRGRTSRQTSHCPPSAMECGETTPSAARRPPPLPADYPEGRAANDLLTRTVGPIGWPSRR